MLAANGSKSRAPAIIVVGSGTGTGISANCQPVPVHVERCQPTRVELSHIFWSITNGGRVFGGLLNQAEKLNNADSVGLIGVGLDI